MEVGRLSRGRVRHSGSYSQIPNILLKPGRPVSGLYPGLDRGAPVRDGTGGFHDATRGSHAGKGIPHGSDREVVQADVLGGRLRDSRRNAARGVWWTADANNDGR